MTGSRSAPGRPGARAPLVAALLAAALLLAACGGSDDELPVAELGGDTTAFTSNREAFGLSARNLNNEQRRTFEVGDSFFTQNWVTAPASTEARDGLGPTFNAQACSSCHVLDGRAQPPMDADDPERGLLLRLSVPGEGPNGGPLGDPVYGGQLQDRAILGVPPEGSILIVYEEIEGSYPDGERFSLRKPLYSVGDPAFGPLAADVMISPRIAPVVVGMGLLEAIPEADILALADPDDLDGDGISGRPNMVWHVQRQADVLGRFGWKANAPNVLQQAAGAFHGDIGITSSLFPDQNCPPPQTACGAALDGGNPEVPDERLGKVAFYVQTLAVPAMRDLDDDQVIEGFRQFMAVGCGSCHVPRHVTGEHSIDALSDQVIFPFTDLLLHDMGEGLADGRPDFEADGQEWRTPPLWGIGLVETVNGHTMFLHDGRARSLEEAILWHGGEAAAALEAFMALPKEQREALLRFLESL